MQRIQESSADSKKPEGPELTERELDVLKLLAQGDGDREIAEKLVVSERTVHFHVGNILSKLHLANRTQAALYAIRKGLAKPDID
jgi:NarL family two-component system response regulator LiaR